MRSHRQDGDRSPRAVRGAVTRAGCRGSVWMNPLPCGAREVGSPALLLEVQSGEWGGPVRRMLRPPWPLSHKPGATGQPQAVCGSHSEAMSSRSPGGALFSGPPGTLPPGFEPLGVFPTRIFPGLLFLSSRIVL